MPNCDWYGTLNDNKCILNAIFESNNFQVYETYSQFEQPLKKFNSTNEVLNEFSDGSDNGKYREAMQLALYVLDSGPEVITRRIKLNPAKSDGALFRFTAEGWGLINFRLCTYIGKKLESSHTNHNSYLRAKKWSQHYPEMGAPSEWDFDKVKAQSSKLNRKIRSCKVAKLGSRAVLPEAYELWKEGICLDAYNPNIHSEHLKLK